MGLPPLQIANSLRSGPLQNAPILSIVWLPTMSAFGLRAVDASGKSMLGLLREQGSRPRATEVPEESSYPYLPAADQLRIELRNDPLPYPALDVLQLAGWICISASGFGIAFPERDRYGQENLDILSLSDGKIRQSMTAHSDWWVPRWSLWYDDGHGGCSVVDFDASTP